MRRALLVAGAVGVAALVAAGAVSWWREPAVSRVSGTVSAVEDVDDVVRVCVAGAVDHRECRDGLLDGPRPEVGDCVTLETQGEGSTLAVEPSEGCASTP